MTALQHKLNWLSFALFLSSYSPLSLSVRLQQCRVSPDDPSLQGNHPLLPNFPEPEKKRVSLVPGHFSFSYSQKKEEVLSVADKLNPIKIWWGVGAWLGTQLGPPACQPGTQPASQPDNQTGRQECSQLLFQSASSQSNSHPARKPSSCLLSTPTSLAVRQITSRQNSLLNS